MDLYCNTLIDLSIQVQYVEEDDQEQPAKEREEQLNDIADTNNCCQQNDMAKENVELKPSKWMGLLKQVNKLHEKEKQKEMDKKRDQTVSFRHYSTKSEKTNNEKQTDNKPCNQKFKKCQKLKQQVNLSVVHEHDEDKEEDEPVSCKADNKAASHKSHLKPASGKYGWQVRKMRGGMAYSAVEEIKERQIASSRLVSESEGMSSFLSFFCTCYPHS